jgi:DNA-binding MarR family transcriptional regulator
MTRSYALLRLLEHGPLSTREIEEITGWTKRQVQKTIGHVSQNGRINRKGKEWSIWK